MSDIGDLIDRLQIVNLKLFKLCDLKGRAISEPASFSKDDLLKMISDDVDLCKMRAALKNQIREHVDAAVRSGRSDVLLEVKSYG